MTARAVCGCTPPNLPPAPRDPASIAQDLADAAERLDVIAHRMFALGDDTGERETAEQDALAVGRARGLRTADAPAWQGWCAMPRLTGNRCQCRACGEYFNGVQPFDHHRIGEYAKVGQRNTRRCLTVAELQARGWVRNAAGFWCERATKSHTQPRAPVFPAPRAPSAMQHHCPVPSAPESLRAGAT